MTHSDQHIAQLADINKALARIRHQRGLDGVLLLEFSHTDDKPAIMSYTRSGTVPDMAMVLQAIGQLIAQTAYGVGKEEALKELGVKTET